MLPERLLPHGPERISDNILLPNLRSFTSLLQQTAHLGSCSYQLKNKYFEELFQHSQSQASKGCSPGPCRETEGPEVEVITLQLPKRVLQRKEICKAVNKI